MQRMENAGIRMAPEKSKDLGYNFKFCGIEFDRRKQEVRYEGSVKS